MDKLLQNLGFIFILGILYTIRLGEGTYCEPINIPLCKAAMPYTDILMPNLLYHSTQENANLVLDQYRGLINTNCSDVLVFFLCSMFAPICPRGFEQAEQERIPPCRHLCQKARAGCEPEMLKYNVSWPKDLACEGLPKYERGVCLSPEAIQKNKNTTDPQVTLYKNSTKGFATGCKCKNITSISARDAYLKNKYYDYAMKMKFFSAKGIKEGPVELNVTIIKVFKQGKVQIKRKTNITLWNENGCVCPRMISGRKYVIMGHEDRRLQRLYYNINSVAGRWKKKWNKSLKVWSELGEKKRKRIRQQKEDIKREREERREKNKRRKQRRRKHQHKHFTRTRKERRKHGAKIGVNDLST